MAKNLYFGEVEPAYSYISQQALDWNKKVDAELIKTNVAGANKLLDEAGFAKGPDGFRMRNGKKIEPLLYGFTGSTGQRAGRGRAGRPAQGRHRHEGAAVRRHRGWGKLATQEFDVFAMSFPYISAGDALNLYFRSGQHPDAQPHELEGRQDRRPARQGHGRRQRRRPAPAPTARCWSRCTRRRCGSRSITSR